MNKRRTKKTKTKKSISTVEVALLLLAALVMIAGGVNYAILKNAQVKLVRETDQVYQSVKHHDMETQSVMVEIDRKVNRFAIKSELREQGSIMRERPDFAVERVVPVERPLVHSGDLQQIFPNLFINVEPSFVTQ